MSRQPVTVFSFQLTVPSISVWWPIVIFVLSTKVSLLDSFSEINVIKETVWFANALRASNCLSDHFFCKSKDIHMTPNMLLSASCMGIMIKGAVSSKLLGLLGLNFLFTSSILRISLGQLEKWLRIRCSIDVMVIFGLSRNMAFQG